MEGRINLEQFEIMNPETEEMHTISLSLWVDVEVQDSYFEYTITYRLGHPDWYTWDQMEEDLKYSEEFLSAIRDIGYVPDEIDRGCDRYHESRDDW